MDVEYVRKLCEDLGTVKKFITDSEFFGNIELEIETPAKQILHVISDRGIFSCSINTKNFFSKKSIEKIINNNKILEFNTLEDAINFLRKLMFYSNREIEKMD